MAEKYVVFKFDDWVAFAHTLGTEHEPAGRTWYQDAVLRLLDHRLNDAVVIRHQDVFAAAAFNEYAGVIRTSIEVTKHLTSGVPDAYDDEEMLKLHDLADFFSDQARAAEDFQMRKLPD